MSVSSDRGPEQRADARASGPRGVAARAGVWSAQHRKTAIWGWLGFVLLAFAIGGGGRDQDARQLPDRSRGVRPRGSHDRQGVPEARRRDGARPERQRRTRRARLPRGGRRCAAPAGGGARTQERSRVPTRRATAGRSRRDGHSALLRFQIAGDDDRGQGPRGAGADARSRRPGRPSGLHGRRVRRRQRREAARPGRSPTTSRRRWSPRCRSRC